MKQLPIQLDKAVALVGIMVGLVMTWLFRENYPELGITLAVACIVYLLIANKVPMALSSFKFQVGRRGYLVSNIIFFGLFTYTMVAVLLNGELYLRPVGYFIGTSLLVALLAVEILTSDKPRPYFTLFKILLIGISLQWIPQAMFPSLTGVDVFGHSRAVSEMLSQGHIPPGYPYAKLPIMPLALGMTSLVTGLGYKFSGMLSIGLFYLAALVFVFLIGERLFNTRVGLLSALMVIISDWFICNGLWAIPNTMGIALVIFLACIVFQRKTGVTFTAVILFAMAGLIMTHTIASLAFSIILASGWLGLGFYHWFYRRRSSLIEVTMLLFFIVAMLSYWMYISGHLGNIAHSIEVAFGLEEKMGYAEVVRAEYLATVDRTEILLNRSGLLLFYFAAIVGILATLSRWLTNPERLCFMIAAAAISLTAFLGNPAGLTKFIPQRFMAYSEIFLSIPVALGIIFISSAFNKVPWKALTLIGLTIILSFLLITNPAANQDSPIYSHNTAVRTSFTPSEIQAAETISQIYQGNILLGLPYDNLFPLPTSGDLAGCLVSKDFMGVRELVPIREYEVNHLMCGFKLDYDPRKALEEQGFSRIYDCGTVSAFLPGDKPPPEQ